MNNSEPIPCYVLLPVPVCGDPPFDGRRVRAGVYQAQFNPSFAVRIPASDGELLGLRPNEFVWCDADGSRRILPPDPAAAAAWAAVYSKPMWQYLSKESQS